MNVDMFNPYWDTGGRQLLFNTVKNGNWDAHLIDIESGRVRPVTTHPADDYHPRFSRDGEWIYFSSKRSGIYEVYKTQPKAVAIANPSSLHPAGSTVSSRTTAVTYSMSARRKRIPHYRRTLLSGASRSMANPNRSRFYQAGGPEAEIQIACRTRAA
jgi:Tol biopolymer transport system component